MLIWKFCMYLSIQILLLFSTENFPQNSSQNHYYVQKNPTVGNINYIQTDEIFKLKALLKLNTQFKQGSQYKIKKMDSLVVTCSPLIDSFDKLIFEYNDINQLSTYYNYSLWNSEWYLNERTINTYGYLGKITERKTDWFNNGNWENGLLEIFDYDDTGNEIFNLTQGWEDNNWVNWYKSISYYDTLNNFIGGISYICIDSLWEFSSKSELYYNSNNLVDEVKVYTFEQRWIKGFLSKYYYDNYSKLDSIITKRWNGSYWENYVKLYTDTLKYGQQVNECFDVWHNNQWLKSTRVIYHYDKDKYFLHAYCEYWQVDKWLPNIDVINVQNPDGFEIHYITHQLDIYYEQPTSVDEEKSNLIIDAFKIYQNYPNPFNPSTTISYSLPSESKVKLVIYDIMGRVMKTLISETQQSGNHQAIWDGTNSNGLRVSSGIYLYRFEALSLENNKHFTKSAKLMLVK